MLPTIPEGPAPRTAEPITPPSRRLVAGLAVLVAVAALLLSGCSAAPAEPNPGDHAPADVTFAQGMIPHHQQAVTMATQARTRAGSAEVRDLAAAIERAQGPEIQQMSAMLASWGAPAPGPHPMSGSDHGGDHGSAMPGMMRDGQMGQLATLSGPAFDRAFLEMMIEHHVGAVAMARTEIAEGRSPQATDLARSIITAQEREITRMRELLGRP